MVMKIVKDKITTAELEQMEKNFFHNMVKAVVDIEKEIMAIDAEMHADLMSLLMKEESSEFKNLWGINLYPFEKEEKRIVFDSLINIRTSLGNKTMGVDDPNVREKIIILVNKLWQK